MARFKLSQSPRDQEKPPCSPFLLIPIARGFHSFSVSVRFPLVSYHAYASPIPLSLVKLSCFHFIFHLASSHVDVFLRFAATLCFPLALLFIFFTRPSLFVHPKGIVASTPVSVFRSHSCRVTLCSRHSFSLSLLLSIHTYWVAKFKIIPKINSKQIYKNLKIISSESKSYDRNSFFVILRCMFQCVFRLMV